MPNGTSQHSPLIIGHRGASALAPENTLAAFKRALEGGAAGVELDVRLAGDGVPVVIHDATLRRTGHCEGVVARMTSAELAQIDVGNWFYGKHPKLERTENSRQVISTLDQVFDFLKQRPTNSEVIYVEMKTDQADETYIDLVESVAQLVNAHQLQSRVVVVSFHLKALARMKTIDASITTGALFEPRRNPVQTMRKHPMITAALECGANQILIHRLIATRRLLALAAENNLLPVVWTVDSPKWMSRTADFGIHALITNNPGLMGTGI